MHATDARQTCRIGVDIGGTFTDLVLMDEQTGSVRLVKMASTPADPSAAFMHVIERVLAESGVHGEDAAYLVHGTTIATNTIIEGNGARTALVTTAGFRDLFEIARQVRPKLYDLFCEKPPPLVPRYLCYEVNERLNAAGEVLTPLDEADVERVAEQLRREQVESVVVCLLHAYVNDDHERRVAEIIHRRCPDTYLSLSSRLCPEMREYFRASTTAINAVVLPVVARYVEKLTGKLGAVGVAAPLHLMTSSGGIMSADVAKQQPVHLVESGPAAGVTAAAYFGELTGHANLISFDMGGTTAKLGLVESGRPRIAPHFEVGAAAMTGNRGFGYPVRTPVVDLVEIGAGGGSIAWIDAGGGLRVGPKSGGADPGPACYDLGQAEPTITDANLVLGRLNPDYFIGGERKLRTDLAERAVSKLADQLGLGLQETAHGILEIASANMTAAAQLISVQRGFDPRDFVLVAFGGAGPLHAAGIARQLGTRRVLVPMSPGVTSALGLLVGDIKHDYLQAYIRPTDEADLDHINRLYADFERAAREVLHAEHIRDDAIRFVHQLDVRYVGQAFELTIDAPAAVLRDEDRAAIRDTFLERHRDVYGYATPDEPTQIVNVRLTAIGAIRRPALKQFDSNGDDPPGAIKAQRDVYFDGMTRCAIYDRYKLRCGHRLVGPAIVEEYDSTTVLPPGVSASVDRFGNILMEVHA